MTWPDGTWLNVAIDMPCKPKEPPKQNLKTFIEIILVNFCLTTTVFCWQSEDENWFIFFFWGGLLFDCFWWFGGSPFLPTLIFQFNFCIWWIQTGVYTGYMCTFFACCIFLKYKSNEGDFFLSIFVFGFVKLVILPLKKHHFSPPFGRCFFSLLSKHLKQIYVSKTRNWWEVVNFRLRTSAPVGEIEDSGCSPNMLVG